MRGGGQVRRYLPEKRGEEEGIEGLQEIPVRVVGGGPLVVGLEGGFVDWGFE